MLVVFHIVPFELAAKHVSAPDNPMLQDIYLIFATASASSSRMKHI